MGFSVNHLGGNSDRQFEGYLRLLRKHGVEPGNLPRIFDPATGNKWLYVWNDERPAQAFRDELAEMTSDDQWSVIPVNGGTSQGPLGPLLFVLTRFATHFTIIPHTLSKVLLDSSFPNAVPTTTRITMDLDTWQNFRKSRGGLPELMREAAPALTGLDSEHVNALGLQLLNADDNRVLVEFAPVESAGSMSDLTAGEA